FNQDGNIDLAIAETGGKPGVYIFTGNGDRTFLSPFQTPTVVATDVTPVALAVADFNKDGNLDLAVVDGKPAGNVEVLLGDGTGNFVKQGLFAAGDNPQSIAVGDLNNDGFPDIVVTNQTTPLQTSNNQFITTGYVSTLINARGVGFNAALRTDVLKKASFEGLDLAGEKGNLIGWQTFAQVNSHGQWIQQTGPSSPLSGVPVATPPEGQYAAMLDQADRVPPVTDEFGIAYFNGPARQASDYSGTHVLYQDFQLPANAGSSLLTLSLYMNNTDPLNPRGYTDPNVTASLDYTAGGSNGNQQVRVDIMDPTASLTDVGSGVIANVFH